MTKIKLGCQTITWGQAQSDVFPTVFAEASASGYAGLEIGLRHLAKTKPDRLKRMLDKEGLVFIATHIGGNLEDTSQAAGERGLLDTALDYVHQMGATRLMYSGLKCENTEQFKRDLDMIRRAAKRSADRGIQLLYHNHDWEFAHNSRIYNALIEETDVGFCPDIGWVMRGGVDVLGTLERIKSRIGAIHFKDFPTRQAAQTLVNPVMLGQGAAPLAEVAQWAMKQLPHVWMIAEQDTADISAVQAARQNAKYLREIFSIQKY